MSKAEVKEQARKAIRGARVIQIGGTLHIIAEPSFDVDKLIQKSLKAGKTVTENGVSQWMRACPVTSPGKIGSMAYFWSGGKVKSESFLFTKTKDGSVTKKSLGFVWVKYGDE